MKPGRSLREEANASQTQPTDDGVRLRGVRVSVPSIVYTYMCNIAAAVDTIARRGLSCTDCEVIAKTTAGGHSSLLL